MASDGMLRLAASGSTTGKPKFLWIAAMLVLTLAAAGAGSVLGLQLIAMIKDNSRGDKLAGKPAIDTLKYPYKTNLRILPPIVCNLAVPSNAWIRIEAALIFDGENNVEPDRLAAQIAEDILGYVKTLSLDDISGPSGLQNLREDLNERVATRSGGKVRELIIQSLVIQ